MTAGIPLSSTGRISSGRRVIGTSRLRRRHDARTGAGTRRLHVDLSTSNSTASAGFEMNAPTMPSGNTGYDRSHALHEALTNAVDDGDVFALRRPVAHIPAFELIGFVGWEVLDRESQLAVFLKRLDKSGRERFGGECGQGASVGADAHPETRWPKGTRSRLRVPANATLARCSRNRTIFSGIMVAQAMQSIPQRKRSPRSANAVIELCPLSNALPSPVPGTGMVAASPTRAMGIGGCSRSLVALRVSSTRFTDGRPIRSL